MSIWLKLLALMALVASFLAPAQAGMCNKHHKNWDPKTKTCPEKPVVLKKREPAPVERVEPTPSRKVTEVNIPAAAASAPLTKASVPSELGLGVSTPSLVHSPAVPNLIIVACGKVTSIGGTVGIHFVSPMTAVQSFGRIDY